MQSARRYRLQSSNRTDARREKETRMKLTVTQVRHELSKLNVQLINKNSAGDYAVRMAEEPEVATYYTNDLQDAFETGLKMVKTHFIQNPVLLARTLKSLRADLECLSKTIDAVIPETPSQNLVGNMFRHNAHMALIESMQVAMNKIHLFWAEANYEIEREKTEIDDAKRKAMSQG